MKRIMISAGALLASASAASAGCGGLLGATTCIDVPEISALDGAAAIAVVLAGVALCWERKRRS